MGPNRGKVFGEIDERSFLWPNETRVKRQEIFTKRTPEVFPFAAVM